MYVSAPVVNASGGQGSSSDNPQRSRTEGTVQTSHYLNRPTPGHKLLHLDKHGTAPRPQRPDTVNANETTKFNLDISSNNQRADSHSSRPQSSQSDIDLHRIAIFNTDPHQISSSPLHLTRTLISHTQQHNPHTASPLFTCFAVSSSSSMRSSSAAAAAVAASSNRETVPSSNHLLPKTCGALSVVIVLVDDPKTTSFKLSSSFDPDERVRVRDRNEPPVVLPSPITLRPPLPQPQNPFPHPSVLAQDKYIPLASCPSPKNTKTRYPAASRIQRSKTTLPPPSTNPTSQAWTLRQEKGSKGYAALTTKSQNDSGTSATSRIKLRRKGRRKRLREEQPAAARTREKSRR